jgi:hypothetical protein
MSGVIVQNLQSGGSPPRTSFSDTLIGADRPFVMGNNWFTQECLVSNLSWGEVQTQINIGASGLIYGTGSGINNSTMAINAFPSLVNRAAVVAKSIVTSIFAELTLDSNPVVGVTAGIGPAVLINPGSDVCYLIQWNSVNTNTVLFRRDSNGTYTTIRANCFTRALGDTCRLEAKIVGGFPQLKVYKNGALQSTDTDASGLGPVSGQFGISFSGVFTGQIVVKNFNGGIGSLT